MADFKLRMSVAEWQKRHADKFTYNGKIGGKLSAVHKLEVRAAGEIIQRLPRPCVLLDSFMGFYMESLELAGTRINTVGWSQDAHYPATLAYFTNMFRRFHCCDTLFMQGYALEGYALMRDVKDRAFLLAAIAHNMTTFQSILVGDKLADPTKDNYAKVTTQGRKDAEHEITKRMFGKDSGLADDVQSELMRWDRLFHYEVHGGLLSLSKEVMDLYKLGRPPSIGPTFDDDSLSMYVNRSNEMGWLIVRLLPLLQMSAGDFGSDWEEKRSILDESFRFMAEELSMLDKKIGDCFIKMVDEKFTFKQPFHYFEADGTA